MKDFLLGTAASLAFALAACGGDVALGGGDAGTDSSTPPNEVVGSVGGLSLVPNDSAMDIENYPDQPGVAVIDLANINGICGQTTRKRNSTVLAVALADGESINKVTVGTYELGPAPGNLVGIVTKKGWVNFFELDAQCEPKMSSSFQGTSGTVTITEITATQAKGTFDMTFAAGHLTGHFTSNLCSNGSAIVYGSGPCAP